MTTIAQKANAMTLKAPRKSTSFLVWISTGLITLNGFRLTGICLMIMGVAAAFDSNGRIPQWIHEQFPLVSQSVLAAALCIPGGILVARDYRLVTGMSPLLITAPLYLIYFLVLIYIQQGVSSPPSLFGYSLVLTGGIMALFVGLHSAYVSDLQKQLRVALVELERQKQGQVDG